jgi:hypothetical protein
VGRPVGGRDEASRIAGPVGTPHASNRPACLAYTAVNDPKATSYGAGWGSRRTMTCFEVGVFEPAAVESNGTSTFASGK